MERATNVLMVAIGGALGSVLRYLVGLIVQARGWLAFPWATLIVNVAGSFLIMLIVSLAATATVSTNLRLFLVTGVMGGLTTYSSFDYETTKLVQAGANVTAIVNVAVTLVACFVAGLLGIGLARLLAAD
ncbi:MAG: fluoride efflux transporter CrcB [Kofleriaceae bacterium]